MKNESRLKDKIIFKVISFLENENENLRKEILAFIKEFAAITHSSVVSKSEKDKVNKLLKAFVQKHNTTISDKKKKERLKLLKEFSRLFNVSLINYSKKELNGLIDTHKSNYDINKNKKVVLEVETDITKKPLWFKLKEFIDNSSGYDVTIPNLYKLINVK